MLNTLTTALTKGPKATNRRSERYGCHADAYLVLANHQYEVEGVLVDISLHGTLFRPRSLFLMRLQNEPVELRVLGHTVRSFVVNTTPRGYGLKLADRLDEALLTELRKTAV